MSEQKNVIHEKSKQSKELAKSAEDQVAELREELFIVKRERNISNSKINAFQDEIEMLKSDNETIIKQRYSLEGKLAKKGKVFSSSVNCVIMKQRVKVK